MDDLGHRSHHFPSCDRLRLTLFPNITKYFCELTESRWRGVPLTLTVDGWSSKTHRKAYLGVTAHYVDVDTCTLMNVPLGMKLLDGVSHTAENLLSCLKSFLEQRHVDTRFIVQIVTDNGANVVRMSHLFFHAFRNSLYYFPHGCAAHTIQLVVKSLLKRKDVSRLIKPISDAVSFIRDPQSSASVILSNYQLRDGKTPLVVIQGVRTRWGTTLAMLVRYRQLRTYVDEVLVAMGRKAPIISSSDLDFLIEILTPFDILTKTFSSEAFSTLGLMCLKVKRFLSTLLCEIEEVPTSQTKEDGRIEAEEDDDTHATSLCDIDDCCIDAIEEENENEMSEDSITRDDEMTLDKDELKHLVFTETKNRFYKFIRDSDDYALANIFLSPNIFIEFLSAPSCYDKKQSPENRKKILVEGTKRVFNGMVKSMPEFFDHSDGKLTSETNERWEEEAMEDDLEEEEKSAANLDVMIEACKEDAPQPGTDILNGKLEIEIRSYLTLLGEMGKKLREEGRKKPDTEFLPSAFWMNADKTITFPLLFNMYRACGCALATSVPCERMFSACGRAIRKERNRMLSEYAEQQIFLHEMVKNVPYELSDIILFCENEEK
eukprot:TRINITY_DN1143_c0_g1_i3.p1 TRINITY_DN1143_c0_g1~~TRINITY_DN1143_c0_g1_i3.p1  ORF type:complete len:603 (-),score=149.69 TRINITY_DN1143_c0_g1_i3:122-1930(-)